jgi:rod shape-determining protein MreC
MPLATLDRSPPPFFKQGPSAFTRLVFFSALAVFMMVADVRWRITQPARAVVATALHPIELVLMAPGRWQAQAARYFEGLEQAEHARQLAQRQLTDQAGRLLRVQQLEQENVRMRGLLALRPRIQVKSIAAEVLYDSPDPFTRKVVIDQGSSRGVVLGSPVVDEVGVLGQVTRVYPLTSEVTLVTDKDAAVPVVNVRTQQRGVAYGLPQARGMELRFMAGNADVQVGDALHTSGLDGVYPPGLPVARVARVDRRADSAFARIALVPLALADNTRHVLLLEPTALQLPERPAEAAQPAASATEVSKGHRPGHGTKDKDASKGAKP